MFPFEATRAVIAKTKEHRYYIRRYSSRLEVRSNGEDEQELLRLTATVLIRRPAPRVDPGASESGSRR